MPAPVPQSNMEKYFSVIAGHSTELPSEPTSRVEYFLAEIVRQGGIGGKLKPRPVSELPATGESGILYLLPVQGTSGQNTHDEYIWIEEELKYELLGQAKIEINLSDYALKSELPAKVSELENDSGYLSQHQDISGKVDKETGKGLSTNDYTDAEKSKLSGIEAQANKTLIDNTLSNAGQAADAKAAGDVIADLKAENALLKELIRGSSAEFYRKASGNPATFSDGYAANLMELVVTLAPTQSGSGDPSPTNVRPIAGATSVTVTRSGEGGANEITVTVPLVDSNSEALTVYGGTLNVTTGELAVTAKYKTLAEWGDMYWHSGGKSFILPVGDIKDLRKNNICVYCFD